MILTPSPVADILIFSILGLIGLHSLKLYSAGRWLLLDPLNLFWGGVLVVYISQPISHAATFIGWHQDGVFEETLFWILFGLIFVVIGYERPIGSIRARLIPSCPRRLIPQRLFLAGLILIFIGILGYLYQFASAGGAAKWLAVGRGSTNWENVSGYMTFLADLLPLGILLLLYHVELHDVARLKRLLVWILGVLMLCWFIYLGTRSRTIMYSMVLLAAYYLPKRLNPPLWLIGGGFMGLFIMVNFQAQYRSNFTNLSLNLDKIDLEEAYLRSAPGFLGGDQDLQNKFVSKGIDFNCVMSVIELVPNKVDYNYGYGHLEVFTRIIPRAIWPDKIYPAMDSVQGVLREGGLSEATVRGRDLLMGPAFTFAGHWYYVGGAVGLALGGLLTGLLLRLIRNVYERAFPSDGDIILYTMLFPIGFGEAVATPLGWITSLPLSLLPVFILFYWVRERATTNEDSVILSRPCQEEIPCRRS